jgi:hypothetical protein
MALGCGGSLGGGCIGSPMMGSPVDMMAMGSPSPSHNSAQQQALGLMWNGACQQVQQRQSQGPPSADSSPLPLVPPQQLQLEAGYSLTGWSVDAPQTPMQTIQDFMAQQQGDFCLGLPSHLPIPAEKGSLMDQEFFLRSIAQGAGCVGMTDGQVEAELRAVAPEVYED